MTKPDLKRCPACKKDFDREKDFGKRTSRGKVYSDTYCRKCRSLRSQGFDIYALSSI